MGLLDSVVGMLKGGGQAAGGNAELLNAVVGMLGNNAQGGGLAGILAKAQQGGLGDIVSSWIGTGQNLPISPDQLNNVLGSDAVANLAQKIGLSPDAAAAQLSQVLPQVVDKLTPAGRIPEGGLGNVGELLGKLMQR